VRFFVLLTVLFSLNVSAHEVQSITQYLNIRKTDQVGWLQDIIARAKVNDKFDVGAQASYLERFDLYEKRLGGFVTYRPDNKWTFEARYLQGMGNQILPEKQTTLSTYYGWGDGYSPFLFYRDTRYTVTTVHTANLGVEIEKIPNFIFVPSVTIGRATFKSPADSNDVYSYGLRAIYYKERKYQFSAWAYKGREASQGIIGQSTILVDTVSGGLGAGYWFTEGFRGELLFDHTDYDQLKTEFHTTTLNLSWMF
jgi:hypothetical protein